MSKSITVIIEDEQGNVKVRWVKGGQFGEHTDLTAKEKNDAKGLSAKTKGKK